MKWFTVVLMILVVPFTFVNCGGGGGGSSSSGTASPPQSQTVSPDNLIVETGGIKVAFSTYDIDGEYTLDVSSSEPQPLDGESEAGKDYQIEMFDLTLNGKSDFTDGIEIVIPYDDTFINTDSVEADSVAAVYFNQETNKYESEVFTVDTNKNEVTIHTSHLSQHGVVVFKSSYGHGPFTVDNEREYTRSARITFVNGYSKVVNKDTAQDIVQGLLDNDFTPDDRAFQAGFSEANTWLGLTATGNTITGSAFSSTFLTELTNAFNLIGVGASIVQVGIDFQNGDDQSLYTNLLKNGVYNTVNYIGWGSLQLAFAGVFIIDYSLNTFASEALDSNEKKWKEVYDLCYTRYYKKSPTEWYTTMSDLSREIKDPDRLGAVIETTVYNQALEVWDDSRLNDCAADAGYSWNALGGEAAAPKTQIAMVKKAEVFNALQPVFFRLGKHKNQENRDKYTENLEKIKNILNQEVDFTITGGSKYEGYSVKFASLNEKAKTDSWKGVIDSSGTFHTKFTILGYMESGSPERVEIFDPVNDQVFDTIMIGKISPTMSFEIGDISKPVASPPSGTEFSDSIDVTLSSPDNAYIIYWIDDGDVNFYNGPISLTDSASISAYADKDPYDENALTSDLATFEYKKTDLSTGKWVLYDKKLIDGCSFYDSDCYALESCSASEGSYQVSIGFSTCGCDTCGGDSGSGSYTVPPDSLTPGETIPFAVTATGDGSTGVDVCFYIASSGITSDQVIIDERGTNQGIGPASCSDIVRKSSPIADWTVPDWDHQGVIKIEGGGSIGNFETSMNYYYLYKWQE